MICKFSRFWAIFLISSPRRASIARAARSLARSGLFRGRWQPVSTRVNARGHSVFGPGLKCQPGQRHGAVRSRTWPMPPPSWPFREASQMTRIEVHTRAPLKPNCSATDRSERCGAQQPVDPRKTAPSDRRKSREKPRQARIPRPGPMDDARRSLALMSPWSGLPVFTGL